MKKGTKKASHTASPYKGSGSITRERFLFYEMRTTAKLVQEGLNHDEILDKIVSGNLYQYPTEKSLRSIALVCLKRLKILEGKTPASRKLTAAIADEPSQTAKQICLYAMMRQYRLVWDFMIGVIGFKYQTLDTSFGRPDINVFFTRLQEQDDWVAGWSDSTIERLKEVLMKILIENEYLDDRDAKRLNPVLISPILEKAIRAEGLEVALSAFHCFSHKE